MVGSLVVAIGAVAVVEYVVPFTVAYSWYVHVPWVDVELLRSLIVITLPLLLREGEPKIVEEGAGGIQANPGLVALSELNDPDAALPSSCH